jgi:hypothetical protein
MIETKQQDASIKPPLSPEMTSKNKKGSVRPSSDQNARTGSFRSKNLPPRPPVAVEKSDGPPRHLQLATSGDDLSFADFSALEDDQSSFEDQQSYQHQFASLSGYLEEKTAAPTFRKQPSSRKVNAVDVASVGNASDTQISVQNHYPPRMSGRDLHEKAKMAFNAGDYQAALPMFESILSAQVRRFSPLHPSVGAAMHNVGVSYKQTDWLWVVLLMGVCLTHDSIVFVFVSRFVDKD